MSLKIAHIVFVILSTSTSLAGAYWANESFQSSGRMEMRFTMILSLAMAVALLIYGVWFYRKLQKNPAL